MRKRKLAVNLLLLASSAAACLLLLELIVRVTPANRGAEARARETRYRQRLQQLNKRLSPREEVKSPYMLLHPYFGYTNVPGSVSVHGRSVDNLGFPTRVDLPYQKKSRDEYVILFLGGSVAEIVTVLSAETLIEKLEQSRQLAGKKILVINCGTGAYKQPQQLLILTYLLSRGSQCDCVVNLDGFNEVAIAAINRKKRISVFYPAGFYWKEMIDYLTAGTRGLLHEPRYLERAYRRQKNLGRERKLLLLMLERPTRFSALARFLLGRGVALLERERSKIDDQLQAITRESSSSWIERTKHGPAGEDSLEDVVKAWSRSSRLMNSLCAQAGILYLHVLQPNQYDPQGKKLTPTERARAFNAKSPFRKGAIWGYPLLREEARLRSGEKINFLDLSGIFNGLEKDIYTDDCCHFNKEGCDMMMERIGEFILQCQARPPGQPIVARPGNH